MVKITVRLLNLVYTYFINDRFDHCIIKPIALFISIPNINNFLNYIYTIIHSAYLLAQQE